MFETAGRVQKDNELSRREIEMDELGFCVVRADHESAEIVVEWYSAFVNESGVVCDPKTKKPIPARGNLGLKCDRRFRGETAKELCVSIFEKDDRVDLRPSMLSHAAYLGRELVFAEFAIRESREYMQD